MFFATTDCSGQAYLPDTPGVKLGMVIPVAYADSPSTATGTPLLFSLRQASRPQVVTVMRMSYWRFSGVGAQSLNCFNQFIPDARDAIPLQQNNPNETGVPESGFGAPLRVISSWLFRDGFEVIEAEAVSKPPYA